MQTLFFCPPKKDRECVHPESLTFAFELKMKNSFSQKNRTSKLNETHGFATASTTRVSRLKPLSPQNELLFFDDLKRNDDDAIQTTKDCVPFQIGGLAPIPRTTTGVEAYVDSVAANIKPKEAVDFVSYATETDDCFLTTSSTIRRREDFPLPCTRSCRLRCNTIEATWTVADGEDPSFTFTDICTAPSKAKPASLGKRPTISPWMPWPHTTILTLVGGRSAGAALTDGATYLVLAHEYVFKSVRMTLMSFGPPWLV